MPYKDPEEGRKRKQAYYLANKDIYKTRARDWTRQRRADMRSVIHAAKDKPCTDCGIKYPYYVMQFDHLEPKTINVSRFVRSNRKLEDLAMEIAKCEVVCANCHAERTYQRTLVR